jgi:hypothetical protein
MNTLKAIAICVAIVLAGLVAGNAQVTIPYSFSSGSTISSTQVNSNFSTLGSNALNRTGGTMTGTLTSVAVRPTSTNTYDLGTTGLKYKDGYFAGTLTTGPLVGTTGTFSGAVSGTTGTFSGAVSGTTFTGAGTGLTGVSLQGKQTLWIPAVACRRLSPAARLAPPSPS